MRQCPHCNRNIGRLDNFGKHLARAHKDLLSVAATIGDEAAVKQLLEDGSDAKSKDIDIHTALFLATVKGHVGIVNLLLDNGADTEAAGDPAWTPQVLASQKRGTWLSWTPLAVASRHGNEDIVRALLQRKASVAGNQRNPPLRWAARNGHTPIVKLLLEAGANINMKEMHYGQTALSHAAENGHEAVVALLLDAGANVDTRHTARFSTPLLLAARNGHVAVVKLLLDHGADIGLSDSGGTPLKWAISRRHEAVARVLHKFSAERVEENAGSDSQSVVVCVG
jgi:ankyrin repeat protein